MYYRIETQGTVIQITYKYTYKEFILNQMFCMEWLIIKGVIPSLECGQP